MAKVRYSRLQVKKWSTAALVSSMLFMLTVVLLILLGLGIFSLPINGDDSPPNDLTSYRRMASERGKGLGKGGEQWAEVLSWKPRASIFHNFLSKEECEYLINLAKPHMGKSSVVDSKTEQSKDSRVCTSSAMFQRRGQDKMIGDIEKRIADYSFIPVEHGEGLQVLHYEVGKKYDALITSLMSSTLKMEASGWLLCLCICQMLKKGMRIFPTAKGNVSAVPWWNELSECGKKRLS